MTHGGVKRTGVMATCTINGDEDDVEVEVITFRLGPATLTYTPVSPTTKETPGATDRSIRIITCVDGWSTCKQVVVPSVLPSRDSTYNALSSRVNCIFNTIPNINHPHFHEYFYFYRTRARAGHLRVSKYDDEDIMHEFFPL